MTSSVDITNGVPPILNTIEGTRILKEREESAATHLKASEEEFSKGMVILWSIREDNLWQFHTDDDGVYLMDKPGVEFGDYLRSFCTQYGLSRSGTYEHLRTVRVWTDVLGFSMEQMIESGVKRSKSIRALVDIDGRTGEITIAPDPVIEQLPPGDTPLDRIRKKVAEVLIEPPVRLPPVEVRRALITDVGLKDEKTFHERANGAVIAVYTGPDTENPWRGVIIPAEVAVTIHPKVKAHIFNRLQVVAYDPGNQK